MQHLNPNVGDIVRVPQNVILMNTKKWLQLTEPERGVLVEIVKNKWPVVYKIYLRGSIWDAHEGDFYSMEG